MYTNDENMKHEDDIPGESEFTMDTLCEMIRTNVKKLYRNGVKDELILNDLNKLLTEYHLIKDGFLFENGHSINEMKRKIELEHEKQGQINTETKDILSRLSLW